jgi:septum site-determining protein MinC
MIPQTLAASDPEGVAATKTATRAVTVRGTRDGVLIVLGDGEWSAVLNELQDQLARPNAAAFFRGARVSVETGNRFLEEREREQLQALLAAHHIDVGAMMPAAPQAPTAPKDRDELYTRRNGAIEALMIRRTLRSGQVIKHSGPVVVYGDVNDGAEIIAAGDVLVFGKLRGVVHAGAQGDDSATIGALALNPPQIRIGNHIARSPEERKPKKRGPEMACVRDGRIVIEPWRV